MTKELQRFDERRSMVQELADRASIQEVIHRMARASDRADAELRDTIFHEDAVDHHGIFEGPASGAMAWAMSDEAPPFLTTQHLIGNVLVELNGDRARSESQFLATHVLSDDQGEYLVTMAGRYFDHFERRDTRWRILERQVIIDWQHKSRSDPGCPDFVDPSVFVWGARGPDDLTHRAGFLSGGGG